jgi:cysteinyl-tRNA synthetase
MIEKLIDRGVAYEANGSVYFDVAAYESRDLPDDCIPYGALSGRQTEDLQSGGRIEENPEKRAPHDFALWKRASEEHFMQWFSPWGWGFPGWHIECSVMAQFYLGNTFDIHGGGMDNKFPHHECEVAQSQAANGRPFARYWLHNNMLNTGGKKMGKSLGNATNLKRLFEETDPMALRFFIAQSQYNSVLEFDEEAIGAASTGYEKLRRTMERLEEAIARAGVSSNGTDIETPAFLTRFLEAMDDDFNTPVALAALFEGVSEMNRGLASGELDAHALQTYRHAFETGFDQILGLRLFAGSEKGKGEEITSELVDMLLQLRTEARARKDFATSDSIRDRLTAIGVILEDTKEGTRWSR